jgi:hypothetical protein
MTTAVSTYPPTSLATTVHPALCSQHIQNSPRFTPHPARYASPRCLDWLLLIARFGHVDHAEMGPVFEYLSRVSD